MTGEDATAKSIIPDLTASIACGVEWLYILRRIPGYLIWNFLSLSNKNILSAVSLAPIDTLPVVRLELSDNSSSASNNWLIATDTCVYNFSPSGVS